MTSDAQSTRKPPRWSIKSLDRDPALASVLTFIEGISAQQIERKCGVSASTIRSWRSGKVRRPQNATIEFSLRAAGFKRIIVPDDRRR